PRGDETALRTRRARDLVVWSGKDHQDGSVNRAPEVEARGQSPPCDFSAIRARVQPHRLIAAFQVGSVDTPAAFDKRRQYQTTSMLLECDAAYTSQPPAPLESGIAKMPILASGGRHGSRTSEVRACLGDGPCDGGDHPNHDGGPVPL